LPSSVAGAATFSRVNQQLGNFTYILKNEGERTRHTG
jgi:hypothetical protein